MGIVSLLKFIAPLTFYILGIVMFLAAIMGKIRWTLLLVVFLIPLRNVVDKIQGFPLGNQMLDILIAGMLLGWVLSLLSPKPFMEKSPLNVISVFLIIYMLASVFIGTAYLKTHFLYPWDDSRIQDWKNFSLLPLLFFLTLNNIEDKKWVWRVFTVMCLSMVLMAYYTTDQINWYSSLMSRDKIHGTFQFLGPNEVAAFLNQYTIILMSVYFFMKRSRNKFLLLLLIFVNIYCILFLYSRGAYLGFGIGMLILFALKSKKLLLPLILILVLWQVVLPEKAVERIKSTKNEYGELDQSSERRIRIWEKGVELFRESPLVGIGYGSFRFLNLDLRDTHNIYIKLLVEQGLVGLGMFLLVIFCFMKIGLSLYSEGDDDLSKGLGLGLFVCMIVLIINNIFGDRWTYFELSGYLWVFAALAVRLNIIAEKNSQLQPKVEVSTAQTQNVLPSKKTKKSYYK